MNSRGRTRCFLYLLSGCLLVGAASAMMAAGAPEPEDTRLWLEEIDGEEALAWVEARNRTTLGDFGADPVYRALFERFLSIYQSDRRIPYVRRIGDHYYNFWQDEQNPRGVWRRTTLASYRSETTEWETVIDIDALGKEEGENWVWKGVIVLEPDRDRCLVGLSRGGADARVLREFDLPGGRFVEDGFVLEAARGSVAWRDRDSLYVAWDFGPGTLSSSGYPLIVKRWERGTSLAEAETMMKARETDLGLFAATSRHPGFPVDLIVRASGFFTNQYHLLEEGSWQALPLPEDASVGFFRDRVLVQLRSDWETAGLRLAAGSLVAVPREGLLAGRPEPELLYQPGERHSLERYAVTKNAIVLTLQDNVRNRIEVLHQEANGWRREAFTAAGLGTLRFTAEDSDRSDAYFLTETDLLTPTTYSRGDLAGGQRERLRALPEFFDRSGLVVTQEQATSADGTMIPYFLVRPEERAKDGELPVLIYGYGGFEISLLPRYMATVGAGWLEVGGGFVLANIRGGGEFGPGWHQAARRENRYRQFEDFAAVAEHLTGRGLTRPERIGIMGGSQGGLLVGALYVLRPELFGAVVSQVPLLDMRRYHRLLAGASWMEEYGDPDDPADWAFLRRYSPYHAFRPDAAHPPLLLTTSTRDDRVHPGHARKMAALVEEAGQPVYYYENTEGGHAGASDPRQQARMQALAYAFLQRHLMTGAGGE